MDDWKGYIATLKLKVKFDAVKASVEKRGGLVYCDSDGTVPRYIWFLADAAVLKKIKGLKRIEKIAEHVVKADAA